MSVVSLVGIEGKEPEMTAIYAYTEATMAGNMIILESTGKSSRDARTKAELKVEQNLDLSMLSTVLISSETAQHDIYNYLDIYFRDPLNPITSKLIIVEGEVRPFIEATKSWQGQSGEYYYRFIDSLEKTGNVIPYTLQTAGSILFQAEEDLALPYMRMNSEEGHPELVGSALFSGRSFSGNSLNPEQSVMLNILKNRLGTTTRLSYFFDDYPLSIRIINMERSIDVKDNHVMMNYHINIGVDEYPKDHLKKKKVREEIVKYVEEQIQKEMNEVIEILQRAKSDALGLGKHVRAYHYKNYQQPWRDHFKNMTIKAKVKIDLIQTGILQ